MPAPPPGRLPAVPPPVLKLDPPPTDPPKHTCWPSIVRHPAPAVPVPEVPLPVAIPGPLLTGPKLVGIGTTPGVSVGPGGVLLPPKIV